ncbi:MAG: hypothetical protein WBB47_09385 [Paenisporosarcina sp.]
MHTNTPPSIVVAFTNVIIICLTQFLYWSVLIDKIDMVSFQLLYFPLLVALTNLFLWFGKFKIEFYQHWIYAAYVGFFCSIIVFFFMSLDSSKELPPGETILHADVLFVLFVSTIQFIILVILNTITFAF